ncbi:MAG: hypothetical protein AMXMBFR33_42700 [Candidatus Xenobia bacterium]
MESSAGTARSAYRPGRPSNPRAKPIRRNVQSREKEQNLNNLSFGEFWEESIEPTWPELSDWDDEDEDEDEDDEDDDDDDWDDDDDDEDWDDDDDDDFDDDDDEDDDFDDEDDDEEE